MPVGADPPFGCSARETAEAVITGHAISEDDEGTYYYPLFVFTAEGKEWQVRRLLGNAGRPAYRVGQSVRVYYPRGRPQDAQLRRFEGIEWALALTAVGLLFIGCTVREFIRRLF